MNKSDFFKGMGLGMAAGAAAAILSGCSCVKNKSKVGQWLHALGGFAENMSDTLGF